MIVLILTKISEICCKSFKLGLSVGCSHIEGG
jgi:hypothetical protein